MAAYSAVESLTNFIRDLTISTPRCISFQSPTQEILYSAYEMMESLQDVLYKVNRQSISRCAQSERADKFDADLREAVWKLEDKLEYNISAQILPQSESFSIDLQVLAQDIYCFSETVDWVKQYVEDDDEEVDEDAFSTTVYLGENISKMVGYTDMLGDIIERLIRDESCIPIVGMAGIGKTTLAKNILEDPLIMETFECRIFVSVGPPPHSTDYSGIMKSIGAIVARPREKKLVDKNYLIVFDDVWDEYFLPAFYKALGYSYEGFSVMVTTRLRRVGEYLSERRRGCNMRFMSKEESWDLLRGKVFADKVCPPHLEEAGKKIAENCEGLPLLIITIADLLLGAEKTPEHWEKVAADKQNSVFVEAYDQILQVTYPSYYFLDQEFKACFLYMAVFPQGYQVRNSRLFHLWSAEYLIKNKICLKNHLQHFDNNTVVVIHPKGIRPKTEFYSLHSVFWYLCKKEGAKNMFLLTLNRRDDCFAKNIERQRRLSIYKNVLFAIKDVYDTVAKVLNARSLLCTGAYHQYQVPICFGSLRLLKVIDALTIRFYEFPMEVLELVLLRHLSLTLDRNLPPSIAKLVNLRNLFVHQHFSVRFTLAESYLPVEIWELRELRHLQIVGRNLPDPPPPYCLFFLETLLDVGPQSCTSGVLGKIHCLKKLRVRIELMPDRAGPLSSFYPHLYKFCSPETLQIVIVNPEIVVPFPSLPVSIRSSNWAFIKKLTLSGLRHSWKDLDKFSELPLEVLKLVCYAFQGEKWETKESGFRELQYLLIEDTDLVEWTCPSISRDSPFRNLKYLTMKSCYKLQRFPVFEVVELVDCNPPAVTYATEKTLESGYELHVHSSWDD